MPTMTPITKSRHTAMRWRRPDSYAFTAGTAVIPLVGAELAQAAVACPIAFIEHGEAFVPAAVLGLEPNRNIFVAEDGRWLGAYVPAAVRGFPFMLAATESGQQLLCFDEASGFLADARDGERFFEADGTLAPAVRQVLDFLTKVEENRTVTVAACAALQARNLIEPWPIAVRAAGSERRIEGLFRVNEAAFNALDDAAFLAMRTTGALPLAFAQVMSMPQLRLLVERAGAPRVQKMQWGQDLDLSWIEGGTLTIGPGKLH